MATREQRREEILRTAARMFAVSGFHGVSIDELGAELGISGPAIYRYFPSKEAILSAMLVDISERLYAGARERVAVNDTAERRLDALIEFHVAFALADPDLIAVQYRDLGSMPEKERRTVRRLQREYVDEWVAVLHELYPKVSEQTARSSAHAAFGLLNSTPYTGRAGVTDLADLLRTMVAAALAAGCSTDEPSSRR
jgi:AcrR family transcriptional regulator